MSIFDRDGDIDGDIYLDFLSESPYKNFSQKCITG